MSNTVPIVTLQDRFFYGNTFFISPLTTSHLFLPFFFGIITTYFAIMNVRNVPSELRNLIDSEETDFIIKSKRNSPRKKGLGLLFFSILWLGFVSLFVVAFLGPLLMGKEVHFTTNNVPTSGSLENWEPVLVPSIIIGVLSLIHI